MPRDAKAPAWFWWGLGGLVVLGLGGVVVVTRDRIRQALRDAFERNGLPPSWGEALGLTESGLAPATVATGPDGARGGAYGPTQITERTARAFGYEGPMQALNDDPELAAELTARMVAAGFAERGGATMEYGRPESAAEMGAVWNAGRYVYDPELPAVTAQTYIPRLLSNLSRVSA